jgi:hypothetical protein
MKPGEAGIVMHLLHDFSEAEKSYPETYETLIEYLRDKNPAIRNLAAWHLNRMAPNAKIGFKPNQTADEVEKLYQQWKKYIPTGKVPPKPTAEPAKTGGKAK